MTATRRPRWIQIRAIGCDKQCRRASERRGQGGEELLRSRVGPLHVGQCEDHGLRPSDTQDEVADRAVEQLSSRLARERREREAIPKGGEDHLCGLGLHPGDRFGEHAVCDLGRRVRPDRERSTQEVGDRAVRAMRVVRRAARPRDACAERSRIREQLVHEPRLAEAGLADDRHDVTLARESVLERTHEQRDFAVSSDERCAAAVGRRCFDAQKPPCDERGGLSFCRDGWVWLVREEARREAIRRIAHEDLARLGRLLEPRGYVHRVAEHAELALSIADGACDGQPTVYPDAQREIAAGALCDAFVLTVERAEDGEGRPLGARGMVDLVVDRAEHRDDGVADVLLDEPVERPDLHRDRVPRGAHVLVKLFGIEPLRERSEPRDVREEHGDLFRLALDGLDRDKPRAAFSTEAERDGHLGRALRTGDCRSPHRPREVTSAALSSGCLRGVLARPPSR